MGNFEPRLQKYYSRVTTRDLGDGVEVNIAPMPNDVPAMQTYRTTDEGHLEIFFVTGDRELKPIHVDELIEVYIGADTNKLAKVLIKESGQKVLLRLAEQLGQIVSVMFQKVRVANTLTRKLKAVGTADLVDRQKQEAEDLVRESLVRENLAGSR